MEDAILAFVMAHPSLIVAISVMQTSRLIFKPLCTAAQTYVDSTVDKGDDEILVAIKKHWAFRALEFVLDWSLSIKIPAKKEVVAVAPTGAA